jgi:hypothetical protein
MCSRPGSFVSASLPPPPQFPQVVAASGGVGTSRASCGNFRLPWLDDNTIPSTPSRFIALRRSNSSRLILSYQR